MFIFIERKRNAWISEMKISDPALNSSLSVYYKSNSSHPQNSRGFCEAIC